jgi:trans-aconitate methyltransferase
MALDRVNPYHRMLVNVIGTGCGNQILQARWPKSNLLCEDASAKQRRRFQ